MFQPFTEPKACPGQVFITFTCACARKRCARARQTFWRGPSERVRAWEGLDRTPPLSYVTHSGFPFSGVMETMPSETFGFYGDVRFVLPLWMRNLFWWRFVFICRKYELMVKNYTILCILFIFFFQKIKITRCKEAKNTTSSICTVCPFKNTKEINYHLVSKLKKEQSKETNKKLK